jgi:hypothetical protein
MYEYAVFVSCIFSNCLLLRDVKTFDHKVS